MLFFSEKNYRGNHAGTKARNDAEMILRQCGAVPVNTHTLELRSDAYDNIRSGIKNRLGYLRYFSDLFFVRNQTVVIQYPMLAFDIQFEYVKKLAKYNRVYFLVHDIHSLRRDGHRGLEDEVRMLNLATGLIVHNRFMEKKLKEIGATAKEYYRLECFDYLRRDQGDYNDFSADIAFAGNLSKSEFIPAMCLENSQVQFNLYGPGWESEFVNAQYQGSFLPDEIPANLKGRFGLVWDGSTICGCEGALGEYTRINNPHKMSLYIAAGIPIIAWEQAAIADFVHRNKIGIAVKQIDSLSDIIDRITEEEYNEMRQNVLRLKSEVTNGMFLQRVLSEIERKQDV